MEFATSLLGFLPPESLKLFLVLALSFLIGVEREEHRAKGGSYAFGGVRVFPGIGILGYVLAVIGGESIGPLAVGIVAVGALMVVSFINKLRNFPEASLATEVSGLVTFLIGPLVYRENYWMATTIVVVSLLLQELRVYLTRVAGKIDEEELLSLAKFLLLTVVILPIVPSVNLTRFQLNPFKVWLVVVTVCTISYVSYAAQRLLKGRSGLLLSTVLGAAYSSTAMTVVLAKKSVGAEKPNYFSGAILLATAVMYARVLVLVGIFDHEIFSLLIVPVGVLTLLAFAASGILTHRQDRNGREPAEGSELRNPLELRAALTFGALFVGLQVVTALVVEGAGARGLLYLAGIMGCVDIDPFILGLTEHGPLHPGSQAAAVAIVLATVSNSVMKAGYAWFFARGRTRNQILIVLGAMAVAGVIAIGVIGAI